jgi:hypothetical protein
MFFCIIKKFGWYLNMGTGAIDRNRQFCGGAVAVFDFLQRKPKNSKNAGFFEKKQVIFVKML